MTDDLTIEDISEIYDEYLARYPAESKVTIKTEDEIIGYPLLTGIKNGIPIVPDHIDHPLDNSLLSLSEELPSIKELPANTKHLIGPELIKLAQAKVTQDHRDYWNHTYKRASEFFGDSRQYQNMLDYLEIVIYLSCWVDSNSGREEWARRNSYDIASYLSYPLLESILKGLCEKDVGIDGKVRQNKKVRKLSQGVEYHTEGDRINDSGTLLWHLETEAGHKELVDLLKLYRKEIQQFGEIGSQEVYGMLNDWRNGLLHGEKRPVGQFAIVVTLLCSLIWDTMLYPE